MRYVDLLFPFFLRMLGFAGWTPSGRSSLSHAQMTSTTIGVVFVERPIVIDALGLALPD